MFFVWKYAYNIMTLRVCFNHLYYYHDSKKYCRNVYSYELYVQGKNYQEIIKCLKVRGKKSGSLVKADPDLSSQKVKSDSVSEEHSSRDCFDTSKLIIHTFYMYR